MLNIDIKEAETCYKVCEQQLYPSPKKSNKSDENILNKKTSNDSHSPQNKLSKKDVTEIEKEMKKYTKTISGGKTLIKA